MDNPTKTEVGVPVTEENVVFCRRPLQRPNEVTHRPTTTLDLGEESLCKRKRKYQGSTGVDDLHGAEVQRCESL